MIKKIASFFIGFLVSIAFTVAQSNVEFVSKNSTCPDDDNGSIVVNVSENLEGYFEFLLTNLKTDNSITSGITANKNYTFEHLSPASYFVSVKHYETPVPIQTDPFAYDLKSISEVPFTAKVEQLKGAGCEGQPVGIVGVTTTGGIAPFSVNWQNGDPAYPNTMVINDVAAGTYEAIVTDAVGCVITATSGAVAPVQVKANAVINQHVLCKGESTGNVTASAINTTGNITYIWSDGQFGKTHDNLAASNTYFVVAKDEINCLDTAYFTITEPDHKIKITVESTENIACRNIPTGKAEVSAENGVEPYVYTWSDGGASSIRNNLSAGVHTVKVTDDNNCADSIDITLTQPATSVAAEVESFVQPLCFGDTNGSALIKASGGTVAESSNYSFLWNDADNDSTNTAAYRTDLQAINYTITVSDDNNCTFDLGFTMNQPDKLVAGIVQTNGNEIPDSVNCFADEIDIKAIFTGGTTPIAAYKWDNAIADESTHEILGLRAGNYGVIVIDNNACADTVKISFEEPTKLTTQTSITQEILCYGLSGDIKTTPVGGIAPYSYLWSNGATTAANTNVKVGEYSVIITDSKNCVLHDTIKIHQPDTIIHSIEIDANVCLDIESGSLYVEIAGGTVQNNNYSILWNTQETTDTITALIPQIYTVAITDDNNCKVESSIDLTQINDYAVSFAMSPVLCEGQSNGEVVATPVNGAAPYTYNWSSGETDAIIANKPAGIYILDITDANGCHAIDTIEITTIPTLSVKRQGITETTCNGSEGSAWVEVTKGTLPYTYLWSSGEHTDSIANKPVGIYSVTITDANGCYTHTELYVKDTSSIQVEAITDNDKIKCAGRGDGIAYAQASYGTLPYAFEWSNGGNTDTITNLKAGIYYVTAIDAHGCKTIDSVRFIEENVLKIDIRDSSMVSCHGGNDGWALVEVAGGIAPYDIVWSNGAKSRVNNDLNAGTYTVTITDQNNCELVDNIVLTEPDLLISTIDDITHIACAGDCNGTARIQASGGVAPYSYEWSNGITDAFVTNLCGGMQSVIVTDSNGCSLTHTLEIYDTIPKLEAQFDVTESSCGNADGKIAVTAVGGISPYSYEWGNGITDTLIENVAAQSFSISITDNNGCILNTIHKVDDFSTITANFVRQSITFCDPCNERYKVESDNGAAPYSYQWNNGDIGEYADSLCNNQSYAVTITDDNGCKKSEVLEIKNPELKVTIVSKNDINCYGGSTGEIKVVAEHGISSNYAYTWGHGETGAQITHLQAGTYTVTVQEDSSVCSMSKQIVLTQQPESKRFFVTDIPSYCQDSTGVLHVEILNGNAPYVIAWDNGEVGDTMYRAWNKYIGVSITDSFGCELRDSAKVEDISDFRLAEKDRYFISCIGDSDGELEVKLDNGYFPFTYSWSHKVDLNNARATELPQGEYTITVTDNRNCKVSYTFDTIRNPKKMQLAFTEPKPIFCYNGTGTLQVETVGGHPDYSYTWLYNNEQQESTKESLSNMPTGTYSVIATDKRACVSDTFNYVFNEPPKTQAYFSVNLAGCGSLSKTGSITLDSIVGSNPPYRFRWHDETTESTWYDDNTNKTKNNLSAGEYYFTVLDSLGVCNEVFENYTFPIIVHSIDTIINHTHCNHYTHDELQVNKPEGSIEVVKFITKRGNYKDYSLFDTITQFANYSFEWNDTKKQTTAKAENLVKNTQGYTVTITGENKCANKMPAGIIDAFVNLESAIKSPLYNTLGEAFICLEDSIRLEAVSAEEYTHAYSPATTVKEFFWSSEMDNKKSRLSNTTGAQIWANPLTKYYSDSSQVSMFYVLDGCTSPTAQFAIQHHDSIEFELEVLDKFDNYLGKDSVFAIQNEVFEIVPTIEPWYVYNDSLSNTIASIYWKTQHEKRKSHSYLKDTITNIHSYDISNKYGLELPAKESSYFLAEATTTHGCKQQAKVFINVYSNLFIPSGITPNGDGTNETWIIPYLYMCPDAVVKVYNRWGVKVFENSGEYYKNPWNGSNKHGKQLPMGTYYYIIEYNDINNTAPQAGAISILY